MPVVLVYCEIFKMKYMKRVNFNFTWNKRGGIIGCRFVYSSLIAPTINRTTPTVRRAMVFAEDPILEISQRFQMNCLVEIPHKMFG